MVIQDWELQVKRNYRKITSQKIAFMLKEYVENNFPDDKVFIRNMVRQIKCSGFLEVYDNDSVKSYFCCQKSCPVCNSIRLAKFLDNYLPMIEKQKYLYHMVLSIRNPDQKKLKKLYSHNYITVF